VIKTLCSVCNFFSFSPQQIRKNWSTVKAFDSKEMWLMLLLKCISRQISTQLLKEISTAQWKFCKITPMPSQVQESWWTQPRSYKQIRDVVRLMNILACNLFWRTMNIQHIEYLEGCQTLAPDPWYLL